MAGSKKYTFFSYSFFYSVPERLILNDLAEYHPYFSGLIGEDNKETELSER